MSMTVTSRFSPYTVTFNDKEAFNMLLMDPKAIFLIDANVFDLYKSSLLSALPEERVLLIKAQEQSKSWNEVGLVYERILALNARKDSKIIAIGGGVIQDIAGFVASTLFRGIVWHLIPTTLLSQADSCIGSKTSINLSSAKNIVGTFYPPISVALETEFLDTLDYRDYLSGLGEIFKLAIIDGSEGYLYFESILNELLVRNKTKTVEALTWTLGIKKRYIEEDELDHGIRNFLNFGHCFGHAIEIVTEFEVPHGQAVTIGIVLADIVAASRGSLDRAIADSHIDSAKRLISFEMSKLSLDPEKMVAAMGKDKKRTGSGLVLIMATTAGHMTKINDLSTEEVYKAIDILKTL